MSFSDLFDMHDLMHDMDTNNHNTFDYDISSSYYNEDTNYIYEKDDDSDYYRYRY